MENNRILARKLFFKGNRNVKFILFNIAVIASATGVIAVIAVFSGIYLLLSLGYIVLAYSFFSLGKEGGISYTILFIFINLMFFLVSGEYAPFGIMFFTLVYMLQFGAYIDHILETERRHVLWDEQLQMENIDYRDKLDRIKRLIEANRGRIKNYKVLNQVAQKLTSALERTDIVKVMSEAVGEMIAKKNIKFNLLILDRETGVFHPAVEEREDESVIKGAVKIYKKDPFDEWVLKNKYNLIIKNLEDDLRFKTLRKDWIKFKSMVAVPLVEGAGAIGILKFFSEDTHAFDNEDIRLLNYLGDMCTAAVQNSMLYQKTKELAIRDGLTGLYMRRYFLERLDDEIKRAKETKDTFSFIMVDIDHFKDCNDTHGHPFGDKVLRVLGSFLRENLRDVDLIGRYGGEEFAIMLPSTKINGSRFVAERLRESYSKLLIKINETEGIKLTLSMGGVEYDGRMKLMEVVNRADKALYYSKENGRNMVTFWEDIN